MAEGDKSGMKRKSRGWGRFPFNGQDGENTLRDTRLRKGYRVGG